MVAVSCNFSHKYFLKTCGSHSMQPDTVHQKWGGEGDFDEGVFT